MIQLLVLIGALFAITPGDAEAACSGSGNSWTCTAGTSRADVQTAYNSGTDPVTITLEAGAYTWATGSITLSNSKSLTLICEEVRDCTVTTGVNTTIYMDTLSGVNSKLYRFSGIIWERDDDAKLVWIYSSGGSVPADTVMQNFRFDHNTVTYTDTGESYFAIQTCAGGTACRVYGVIDNNIFEGAKNYTIAHLNGPGLNSGVDLHPEDAGLRATASNMFIEDNQVIFDEMTNAGLGCIDLIAAASVVVRNNYSLNCLWTSHSTPHSGGGYNFEFYRNVVEQDAGAPIPYRNGSRSWHHQGSGEITLFGNRFLAVAAYSGNFFELTHYRTAVGNSIDVTQGGFDDTLWGRCDDATSGSLSVPDGNTSPRTTYYGYPCWMQPGRAPASSGPGTLSPVYVWDNQKPDGTLANLYVNPQWSATYEPPDVVDHHVVEERDWYEAQTTDSSTFDGTIGVGFGELSDRPATCTTNGNESGGGVAYFATNRGRWNNETAADHAVHSGWGDTHDIGDDGLLYRCSATDTWSLHYTPYPYPHPLRHADTQTALVLYVNTASSSGGDCTSNLTSGSTKACESLRAAMALVSTAAFAEADDTLPQPYVILAEGTAADTLYLKQTQLNFKTTATNNVHVIGDNTSGKFNTSAYRLEIEDSDAVYNNNPGHLVFENFQVQLTVTTSSSAEYVGIRLATANNENQPVEHKCIRCIVKMIVTGTDNALGFYDSDPSNGSNPTGVGDVKRINSIAYGGTYGFGAAWGSAANTQVKNYNVTSYGNESNYVDPQQCVNCISASHTTGSGFLNTGTTGHSNNASTDATAGGTSARDNQTFSFVDAAAGDFHLQESDTGAKGFGASDPLSGGYLDDIDGNLRGATWDIGADQYGAAEELPPDPPASDGRTRTRRLRGAVMPLYVPFVAAVEAHP